MMSFQVLNIDSATDLPHSYYIISIHSFIRSFIHFLLCELSDFH